jgi:hypothetical protein
MYLYSLQIKGDSQKKKKESLTEHSTLHTYRYKCRQRREITPHPLGTFETSGCHMGMTKCSLVESCLRFGVTWRITYRCTRFCARGMKAKSSLKSWWQCTRRYGFKSLTTRTFAASDHLEFSLRHKLSGRFLEGITREGWSLSLTHKCFSATDSDREAISSST